MDRSVPPPQQIRPNSDKLLEPAIQTFGNVVTSAIEYNAGEVRARHVRHAVAARVALHADAGLLGLGEGAPFGPRLGFAGRRGAGRA